MTNKLRSLLACLPWATLDLRMQSVAIARNSPSKEASIETVSFYHNDYENVSNAFRNINKDGIKLNFQFFFSCN